MLRFFFFCMWMSSCSSITCGRDYFAQLYCLCSSFKDQLTIWGTISRYSSLFHLSIFLFFFFFFHKYHTVLITAVLLLVLKLGSIDPPILIFPFDIVLAVLGLLPFLINFRNQFVSFHKMTWWSFGCDCTDSTDQFGKNWHPYTIKSSYPWTWNISPFV